MLIISTSLIGVVTFFNIIPTPLSPDLKINSVTVTPGPSKYNWASVFPHPNFTYGLHINLTLNFKTPMSITSYGLNSCSFYDTITSNEFFDITPGPFCTAGGFPHVYYGTYHFSLFEEVMANSNHLTYPLTLSIFTHSPSFLSVSNTVSLNLTSKGEEYLSLYGHLKKESLLNGSIFYNFYANLFFMTDHPGIVINNCSNTFNFKFNTTDNWRLANITYDPSSNVTLQTGTNLFNVTALLINPNGQEYFSSLYLPSLPLIVYYNQNQLESNSLSLSYS